MTSLHKAEPIIQYLSGVENDPGIGRPAKVTFRLLPILDEMLELYDMPRSPARFQAYLHKLQGSNGGDLKLPIGGYNPMGGAIAQSKVRELISLGAEKIASDIIDDINGEMAGQTKDSFATVINVIDDVQGSWSHYHSTDFDQRFKLDALCERYFCTPYFFTGEQYNESLIRTRVMGQIHRSKHWLEHGAAKTLHQHIEQEVYVAKSVGELWKSDPLIEAEIDADSTRLVSSEDSRTIEGYLKEHALSENHSVIFNFLYGDKASQSLGYPCFGMSTSMGFRYICNRALGDDALV